MHIIFYLLSLHPYIPFPTVNHQFVLYEFGFTLLFIQFVL